MATLNLSANGPSINNSYLSVVNASAPTGPAASSATYGQWAVYSVAAPLVSAFQGDSGKESILKVQSTGEGELVDLIDEFSDGRIQFAFVRVKDPNTGLPKFALIGWCGEGVPERTKGYFANHQAAVAKVLHGYHVQISARSDRDLSPEVIVQKISDASGAKYSAGTQATSSAVKPPPVAKKPVFTPTSSKVGGSAFNPLANRRVASSTSGPVDDDGWGADAPPVTRTQLEKVESAYKPTKVNMKDLASQPQAPSQFAPSRSLEQTDVVRGGYQPVGKVDIAAIRREAAETGGLKDERPTAVKGAYEPVGKVDIAAIRARAQQPGNDNSQSALAHSQPQPNPSDEEMPKPLSERSTAFQGGARLAELPKPKVANRFDSNAGSFAGTKPLAPGTFGLHSAAPNSGSGLGSTGRSYADSAGKSPAQLWAEKKASQGESVLPAPISAQAMPAQKSGGWKSGYEGKKWAPVQISKTDASATSAEQEAPEVEDHNTRDISSIRGQFSQQSSQETPVLNTSNKPNMGGGIALPGFPVKPKEDEAPALPTPPPQPRSPTPPIDEEDEGSPVRIAVPVARGADVPIQDARNEQTEPPPPIPIPSLAEQVPREQSVDDEPEVGLDPAREAGKATASMTSQTGAIADNHISIETDGQRALVQYDYERAEDNELELREGEVVTNIEMVDENWWMGKNPRGETGLFPSAYVELMDGENVGIATASIANDIPTVHEPTEDPASVAEPFHAASAHTATALYDYEAAEDNELSFPEGAKITGIEFPDEEWWSGEFNGVQGLFPATYVELDQ